MVFCVVPTQAVSSTFQTKVGQAVDYTYMLSKYMKANFFKSTKLYRKIHKFSCMKQNF